MFILAIIAACTAAVLVILALLPAWTPVDLDGPVADLTGTSLFAGLGWLNSYFPVDTLLQILGLQLSIWAAVYVVRFVIWLLQLFRIAGGGRS
jgi:hypothetical protein